jgi:polyphenol oxidase
MTSPVIAPALASLPGIRHGFFTRDGGVSTGVYEGLNCGLGSDDSRAAVIENRRRVAAHLGTSGGRLITCYQIHSADAVIATAPWTSGTVPKADAVVTATPGLAVGALAADCCPILFADPEAKVVAAAHAGWKGAVGGVVAGALAAMERLGAARHRIRAAFGPCISQASYEVGPEFQASVLARDPAAQEFFVTPAASGRAHFDLPGYVARQLAKSGVGAVENVSSCTYRDESRFYSFRRTTHRKEPDYGRQISAIVVA